MSEDNVSGASPSKIGSLSELESESGGEYGRWQSEITASEKEQDKWRRKGRKVVKQFRSDKLDTSGVDDSMQRRYNLFPANINILSTALLNQTPKPTVNREFKDPVDDVSRVACWILERALDSHNSHNFCNYNILKQVVQDMLVPGLGVSWHTYHAEIQARREEPTEEQLTIDPTAEALEYDEVVGEQVKDEYVYWEDVLWSPARTWEEVRWIARKIYMTRDQLTERWGKKGKDIPLDYTPKKNDIVVETKNIIFQQATIYEIWDKEAEEVIWFSKHLDKLIEQKPDFLELDGFFPCPRFLVSTISNGQFIPIPDYHYAEDQYRELNEINTRISLLVRACRVAGVYDKAASQVQALLNNAAENTLVPVDQWAAFAEKGGIKGVIDWIPLDQIVLTIDQLLKNREDVKNQIYEITGMSDIIRGQSKATETLGAQKIKTQYASMRIQERQKNVVEYASNVFDIQAQLMRKHMAIEEITKLAQVQFMNEPPEVIQEALQLLQSPDFILRARVESDTLSDIDFQSEKQDRMEYMMTITNYLKETMPMIQEDPIMAPFLMQLLQFSLAGFKIGKKFEGELDRTFMEIQRKLQNPQPPPPTPEEQKIQAEMQQMQQEGQMKAQQMEAQMGADQQKAQLEQRTKMMELDFKKRELELEMRKLQMELQIEQQKMDMDIQGQQAQMGMDREKMGMEMQGQQAQTALDQQVAQQTAQTNVQMNDQKLRMGEQQNSMKLKQGAQQFKQNQAQGAQQFKQSQAQAKAKPAGKLQ